MIPLDIACGPELLLKLSDNKSVGLDIYQKQINMQKINTLFKSVL